LNRIDVGLVLDVEAAELLIANDAILVKKDTVGNEFIAVYLREAVLAIYYSREGCRGCLDPGTRRCGALCIDGDRNKLNLILRVAVTLDETLPPGQLIATASPAAPEEQRCLLAME
jgi:hypothetical protein